MTPITSPITGTVVILGVLALVVPGLAVQARRLHGTGRSAWWVLGAFAPGLSIVVFVVTLLDSTPGPNRYGPNPGGA